jgi:uncharacterized protein (TIGR02284 family)
MSVLQGSKLHQVNALNDLVRINNDRITAYNKALDVTNSDELEHLFHEHIFQSEQNIAELTDHINKLGGKLQRGPTLPGKFYHAWLYLRSSFASRNMALILDECEYGEDVSKCAYLKALKDNDLGWKDNKIISALNRQLRQLKNAYLIIRSLRNAIIDFN